MDLLLISYPARTAMPTCGFPAWWTPEAAKLSYVLSATVSHAGCEVVRPRFAVGVYP
jgi:hypothetical protein